MKICTVDIETEFIPDTGIFDIKKIHCIGVKINEEPTKCFTSVYTSNSDGNLTAAINLINSCDYIVGHNLAKFDRPVLEANFGKLKPKTIDTLIDANLLYTSDQLLAMDTGIKDMPKDLWGRFSLKAFGYRFGDYKIEFEEFDKLSADMVTYCKQDVDLTYRLYKFLSSKPDYPNTKVRELEYSVAEVVAIQEYVGFYVDSKKARELFLSLKFKETSLKQKLLKTFKPKFLPDGPLITPAGSRKNKLYRPNPNYQFKSRVPFRHIKQLDRTKNGKWKLPAKTKYKYFSTPHTMYYSYTNGEYQKIKLTKFDPGSRHKIRQWLSEDFGFTFPYYTPKGNAKVDADSLENLDIPEGKLLKEYLKTVKDLSQLESGTGSILKNIRADSTVTSNIQTNGTVTGRFTSSNINLNQIPAQKEFRELFSAPEGWTFVGSDFSQQELVNLAELLYPYDGGKYYEIVSNGDKAKGTDIHTINAKKLDVSRDEGKALNFGFLYGSSETLTGYSLLGNKEFKDYTPKEFSDAMDKLAKRKITINDKDFYPVKKDMLIPFNEQLAIYMLYGKMLHSKLIQSTEGLGELIRDLTEKVNTDGYATTILGRRIPAESSHVALNYHCQGMGAEAMKVYLHLLKDKFSKFNPFTELRHQATIYDEVDYIVRSEFVAEVSSILKANYADVSKYLGMKCTYSGEVLCGRNWAECH